MSKLFKKHTALEIDWNMGSNRSKPTQEKITHKLDVEYESEYELPQRKHQHNHLQNPNDNRPIELSWLQQNNTNDNYNRIDHQHHHHIHHDEHLRRIPLAINRWPKDNDQTKEQKSKSFIEEYIHQ